MTDISLAQQNFLSAQKKHKRSVTISRLCVFLLFLGLWEVTSQTGLIDSFIFSSPSKIFRCAYGMVCADFFTGQYVPVFQFLVMVE